MGIVIRICAYGEWERIYFVQSCNESEAKEKAYEMFKQTMSCYLPDTLELAETNDGFFIEIVAEVEQIIL
ncbi:MAG: hypothetical protein II304_08915 [Bacteroidales bacterium]|nr:hypothetical protein [Bacteroidales bacterium]